MNSVGEDEHGPKSFMTAGLVARCAVHLFPSGFWWSLREHFGNELLRRGCDTRHVLGAENIDRRKSDGKVRYGEQHVHAEGIPAVGLDEVLESL